MSSKVATNAERIARSLKRNGVKYLFGQSNPPSVTLACSDIGIQQIGYRQENAGSYMAHGYAMTSKTIPVVTAQNGPAATLLVPGLAESLKSSYPVIALVEEVARNHEEKNAFQELDHEALFAGVAKWVKKLTVQDTIEDLIDRAFTIAASGRPGPVVLLCPKDIINDPTPYEVNEGRTLSLGQFPLDRTMADPTKIETAANMIAQAKQPLIYAGGGVITSGAQAELQAIQETFSIPVATTTMGKGAIDENHPLSLGPIGYYMGKRGPSRFLKSMVQGSDVIVLVGNRTNQNGTDSWELLPKDAQYIHIDIDPTEIGRNYESLRLVGDAKLTLATLQEKLVAQDMSTLHQKRAKTEDEIAQAKQSHKEVMHDLVTKVSGPIKVEQFLHHLDKKLSNDHIIVADASISSVWNASYLQAKENRKFIFPRGLAGLGWGLPMAMGAKLAAPKQKVFCLAGDGGFAHVWSELETCRRHGIDVVLVVINNGILGYQKYAETSMLGRYTDACDFRDVDHTKVAEACGVKGIKLDRIAAIDDVIDQALQHEGSVVVDLISDPDNIPPVTIMDDMIKD